MALTSYIYKVLSTLSYELSGRKTNLVRQDFFGYLNEIKLPTFSFPK